jgi:aminoglycoside 6'-N-acetyltransferase
MVLSHVRHLCLRRLVGVSPGAGGSRTVCLPSRVGVTVSALVLTYGRFSKIQAVPNAGTKTGAAMCVPAGTVPNVTFRPLTEPDLPAMKRWLEDPDVAAWYREDSTGLEALREQYRDMFAGEDPTRGFVLQIDGLDAGYIQCYVIDDEPDYARQVRVDAGAVGIDLFIGEPAARNRGYGSVVLRAFVSQVVFGQMGAEVAIIAPSPENRRAIRAYEKVGFTGLKTVFVVDEESPVNTGHEYVMRLTREAYAPER